MNPKYQTMKKIVAGTTNARLLLVSARNSGDRSIATQSVSVRCSDTEHPLHLASVEGATRRSRALCAKSLSRAGSGARMLFQHPLVRDGTRRHRAVNAHVDQ